MALNIKNLAVETLAELISHMTGETKTEAIRKSLEERKERLDLSQATKNKSSKLTRFLEREAWPAMGIRDTKKRISKKEIESILGYKTKGV